MFESIRAMLGGGRGGEKGTAFSCPMNVCPGRRTKDTDTFRTLHHLRESSKKGCLLCSLILSVVEEMIPGWTTENEEDKLINFDDFYKWDGRVILLQARTKVMSFALICRSEGTARRSSLVHSNDTTIIQTMLIALGKGTYSMTNHAQEHLPCPIFRKESLGDPNPIYGLQPSLDVSSDSSSAAAFDRARTWLEYCEDHDTACRIPLSTFKPTRLLKVHPSSIPDQVLLVQPSQPVKYACLSYCWGKDLASVVKTTNANLETHYQGISYRSLPKTIQDALLVCRGLGIQYLWVDALCIIQDDPQDWQRELGRNVDIYGKSHLTIYANEPESCKQGFLGPLEYSKSRWQRRIRTQIPEKLTAGENRLFPAGSGLFARFGHPDRSRVVASTDLDRSGKSGADRSMAKSTLDSRAWCLQEEILPNRRLYYDNNEMTWQCCTRYVCECGHLSSLRGTSSHEIPLVKLNDPENFAAYLEDKPSRYRPWMPDKHSLLVEWRRLVEDYSLRLLSNPEDKLAAISGLSESIRKATELLESTPDSYYAGLWGRKFLQGLAWVPCWPASDSVQQPNPSKAITYRAPTWSWASNNAPVSYDSYLPVYNWKYTPTMITRTVVDEVSCVLMDSTNPTGKVKAGHACLTGPMTTVELVRLDKHLCTQWNWTNSLQPKASVALVRGKNFRCYEVSLDLEIGQTLKHTEERSRCWLKRSCECGRCSWIEKKATVDKTFCFELFTWQDDRTTLPSIPSETWYLLLQETPDGTYERIGAGVCEARSYGWRDKWPKVKVGDKSGLTFECPLFQESEIKSIKII